MDTTNLGTAKCPTCQTIEQITDRHEEHGDPDHHGNTEAYDVRDLACGHQTSYQLPGRGSSVL